jgi:hypothetical protein
MWHVMPSMKSHMCALNGEYRKILKTAKSFKKARRVKVPYTQELCLEVLASGKVVWGDSGTEVSQTA